MVNKIRNRLLKWNGKHISFTGQITLIQTVLSVITIYCLSFYRIPLKTIREITHIQREFLWGGVGGGGGSVSHGKTHWVNWRDICKEKSSGGLGIFELLWVRVIKFRDGGLEMGRPGGANMGGVGQ
ncbi:hypothetical protein ACS0TY_013448 [Phlomoides rotata]